jgi:hypothetical protein
MYRTDFPNRPSSEAAVLEGDRANWSRIHEFARITLKYLRNIHVRHVLM